MKAKPVKTKLAARLINTMKHKPTGRRVRIVQDNWHHRSGATYTARFPNGKEKEVRLDDLVDSRWEPAPTSGPWKIKSGEVWGVKSGNGIKVC